jgi:hypothetical protein
LQRFILFLLPTNHPASAVMTAALVPCIYLSISHEKKYTNRGKKLIIRNREKGRKRGGKRT